MLLFWGRQSTFGVISTHPHPHHLPGGIGRDLDLPPAAALARNRHLRSVGAAWRGLHARAPSWPPAYQNAVGNRSRALTQKLPKRCVMEFGDPSPKKNVARCGAALDTCHEPALPLAWSRRSPKWRRTAGGNSPKRGFNKRFLAIMTGLERGFGESRAPRSARDPWSPPRSPA